MSNELINEFTNEPEQVIEISPEEQAYRNFALKQWFGGPEAFDVNDPELIRHFDYLYNQRPAGQAFVQDASLGMLGGLAWGLGPMGKVAGSALGAAEDWFNTRRNEYWDAYQIASQNGRRKPTQEEFNAAYAQVHSNLNAMKNIGVGLVIDRLAPPVTKNIKVRIDFPANPIKHAHTKWLNQPVEKSNYKVLPLNELASNIGQS